jgi:hypothetical protein
MPGPALELAVFGQSAPVCAPCAPGQDTIIRQRRLENSAEETTYEHGANQIHQQIAFTTTRCFKNFGIHHQIPSFMPPQIFGVKRSRIFILQRSHALLDTAR